MVTGLLLALYCYPWLAACEDLMLDSRKPGTVARPWALGILTATACRDFLQINGDADL